MFWFVFNFWWIWLDKRKNVSENLLKVRGHIGFLMFSHLRHIRFLLLKLKKDLNQFEFYFASATKNFRKKVARQRNLTWGHAETFICDCNMFRFLLPLHKNFFRIPLDLLLTKFSIFLKSTFLLLAIFLKLIFNQ